MKNEKCKKRRPLIFFSFLSYLLICYSLLITACDFGNTGGGTGNYQRFDWDLHGTWKTNDPGSTYTGTLVITYSSITITGYSETQTPTPGGSDQERPCGTSTSKPPTWRSTKHRVKRCG